MSQDTLSIDYILFLRIIAQPVAICDIYAKENIYTHKKLGARANSQSIYTTPPRFHTHNYRACICQLAYTQKQVDHRGEI